MGKITDYEIINHGYEEIQYWCGCGTSFTEFAYVVTGVGDNAKEAYEDALDLIAYYDLDVSVLPKRPKGIRASDKVPNKLSLNPDQNWFYRVSVRFNIMEVGD